jgi:hypothetical protein
MKNTSLYRLNILIASIAMVLATSIYAKDNVLLIGDSITMHYAKHVIEEVGEHAAVYKGNANATSTSNFLENLIEPTLTAENCKWDVIWFNLGLWDTSIVGQRAVRKDPSKKDRLGKPNTPIEQYEENLVHIIKRFRDHSPGVKLIFATTSPTADGVEIDYNMLAKKVMKANDVVVFDLYQFTKKDIELLCWKSNVHYSTVADKLLAPHIADAIVAVVDGTTFPAVSGPIKIAEEMVPVLRKESELGHPKFRNKKK